MSIKKGSRYEFSTVDFLSIYADNRLSPVVFYDFPGETLLNYYEHVYVRGERLDQISQKYYNKPNLWWLITDYNPQITDILNIPAGTMLKVPRV
jgi:hypothetical protein